MVDTKNNIFLSDVKKIAPVQNMIDYFNTFSKSFYDVNKNETSKYNFYNPLNKDQFEINNTLSYHNYFEQNKINDTEVSATPYVKKIELNI